MKDFQKDFKVLAVDDNPKNIQVIGSILLEADYEVGFAMDGKQAIDLLNESKDYDLVLLDVNMPVMNGFDACRIMRRSELLQEIPVIFLTAMNETEHILAGFDAGGQDYVTKPFNAKELLSRVKTHLELKRSRDQLKVVNQWLEIKVKERTQELQKAYNDLEVANNELIQLDRAKAEFLEKLSNEIRAPLAGMIGFISVLKNEINPEELTELLKYLDVSIARLERFTTVSMLITELRTKTTSIVREDVQMADLIEFVKHKQLDQIQLRNMTIELKGDVAGTTIHGERNLLEICFENLVDNALKHSPTNSSLTVGVEQRDGMTVCSFRDHGRCFSEDLIKKIQEVIAKDNTQMEENETLDLSLVKLIMDAHMGKLEILNNSDVGATIELHFPDYNDITR